MPIRSWIQKLSKKRTVLVDRQSREVTLAWLYLIIVTRPRLFAEMKKAGYEDIYFVTFRD